MLKSLITPLLIALCAGSTFYYTAANRNAQAVSLSPAPAGVGGTIINAQPLQPPPPPLPPTRLPDVDAMIVIDNSGSMFGRKCKTGDRIAANDSDQLRIQGANLIVGALAADLKPRETTLGIVTFGDAAMLVRPLTQLSNEDSTVRSDLAAAIEDPPCQGDTNIAAAIRMAQQELRSERATPGNAAAIIFLTDGNPTQGGTLGDLEPILNDLGEVQFFAVILGTDPQLEQSKQFWRAQSAQHPNVTYHELLSSAGITPLYNVLTAKLNNCPDCQTETPLPPGQHVTLPVPANVRQAVMKVIKRTPTIPVTIQDPSGADPRQLPPDRFRALLNNSTVEVYVIERPPPGDWVFSVPDGEVLTVLQPEYRSIYEVQLLQPDSYGLLSVDQPTKIVVQVGDVDSKQLLTDVFTVTGTFRQQGQPESAGQPITLSPGPAASQYNVEIPTGTFAQNQQYILTFLVQDAAGLGSQPTIYQVPAGRMPVISALTAAPLSGYVDEPISLTALVTNTDVISGTPLMSLAPPPGVTGTAFQSTDQITYQATLPPLKRPGTYMISASFRGQTTAGRDFNATDTVTVVVRERWWMIALRYLALAASLLTGAYLICRFVLIRPLMPIFQKIGIAPQGYICTISPDGYKSEEQNLRDVLRRKRKCRTLTIGVGPRFDIPLEPPPTPLGQDDDATPRKRPGLWERLWGPKAPARITRRGGSTVLIVGTGSGSLFTTGTGSKSVEQSTIEYSLKSMSGDDDQS